MKPLRILLTALVIALLYSGNTLYAQNFMLPDIDFASFEKEALDAVQKLPHKGGFKKKEVYYHLYVFAAQMRENIDWGNIKTQADFIRAIDIQTPVLFDGYTTPTNIYADYIYDSEGNMRWIYADGKATKVDLTETGNSPQNFLIEVARLQYQMVFVLKEALPQKAFFGIKDGVAYMTFHLMWEAYDTYTIQQSIALHILEPIATGKIVHIKKDNLDGEPTTPQDLSTITRVDTLATMPTFMGGGLDKFREWFMGKFLPRIPNDLSQSVKIIIGFVVGTDGNVENVDIQYTDNVELAQIAVNIVKNAPQWTPGIHNGEPIRTHYSLPIQIEVK